MLPKSLYLGQPCRQVDHRLFPQSCKLSADCQIARDQLREVARCQAEQHRPGPPLGASRDHNMYVGLTCKVPSITRRPPRCRCVRQATAVARSLPCSFPPPHSPPTRSMACSSCLCTASRGPITAPVLCHRQRRRRRAKVVARYGSTHTQTCLFPMEVAWFRWAGSAAGLYVRPNAGVFFSFSISCLG